MVAKKRRGLGTSLTTLLGDDVVIASSDAQNAGITEIALDKLQAGKYQPRSQWEMEKLTELAASIKEQGVISPIIVRPAADGLFEIIAGERRFRASKMAGKSTIPAIVRSLADKDALAVALIENMQRADLNAMEQALGVKKLIDEFDYTHEQAAQALGRSRSATTNLLRLLNLAEPVQQMLMDGKLEMGHARALLGVDGARQSQLAQEIVAKGLSVRETEKLAAQNKEGALTEKKKVKTKKRKDRDTLDFEEQISDALGAKVEIEYKKRQSGRIVVGFNNLDELNAIAERILALNNS